jgi:lysozyme
MNLSREGAMELIGHEAIVLTRYKDSVGVWTIGVGHTKGAGPPDPETFMGALTLPQAFDLFERDVRRYVADVNAVLKVKVSQAQFDALVSFHFNTGAIRRASLVNRINDGDMDGAALGFMAWVKPIEITKRRTKERDLFVTGRYSNGGMVNVYPADPNGHILWNKPTRTDLRKAIGFALPSPKPTSGRVAAGTGAVIVTTGAGGVIAKHTSDKGANMGQIGAVVGITLVIAISAYFIIRHWKTS